MGLIRRFTLVELMVVVAILMVLAAIGLPQLHNAQLRARHAERQLVMEGIADAVLAYDMAAPAAYVLTTGTGLIVGRQPQPWPTGTDFEWLGFSSDGDVRCTYDVQTVVPVVPISGVCDLDGDGEGTSIDVTL